MKNYKKYMGLLLLIVCTACNDWLNISPATEKKKEEMYSTQDGFRNVLTGAYIRMKSAGLYGEAMTCGTVEYLAQHWDYTTESLGAYLNKYDYKAAVVESNMTSLFNNLYKVIADVNGILEMIDQKKDIFEKNNYELIKGEALTIRAFCHFDLLRLFGPVPGKIPGEPILPYVKIVNIKPNNRQTWTEYTNNLMADLQEAEEYFEKVDPICHYSIADLNSINSRDFRSDDNYMGYRQMRMNYYAVQALKARIYLWMQNPQKALEYAMKIIDAMDNTGEKMYRLGNSKDCSGYDYSFSSEHILNLNVYNLATGLGSSTNYERTEKALTSRLYELGTTDIRFLKLWETVDKSGTAHHYNKKYWQTDDMPSLAKNSIPLIRLYEMYLIALECSPLSTATELYKEMCIARDITPLEITDENRTEILIKEYNKEFYAEGQAFYAYKRLFIEDIYDAEIPGSLETYIIPLPKQEILYAQ